MTSHDHFFQDEVCLVEVEDEIELAYIAKVPVEHLDEVVDNIEDYQLIVFFLDASHEV